MIFFISGHLDLTQEEFQTHYVPLLREAISMGDSFIVGDARGTDAMAQEFLAKLSASVIVYHMFELPRNNCGFEVIGGFRTDQERDEAMTKNSDADIAWIRPGREKSGTAKNLLRRVYNVNN
jgi:hypothetical protein